MTEYFLIMIMIGTTPELTQITVHGFPNVETCLYATEIIAEEEEGKAILMCVKGGKPHDQ